MKQVRQIISHVAELRSLCPTGMSAAMYFGFQTPKMVFLTYTASWWIEYSFEKYILDDCAMDWGMKNRGATRWNDIPGSAGNKVLEAAAKHGINHGFCYAIDCSNTRSIFNGSRGERAFTDGEIEQAARIFDALHKATKDLDHLPSEDEAELRNQRVTVLYS